MNEWMYVWRYEWAIEWRKYYNFIQHNDLINKF